MANRRSSPRGPKANGYLTLIGIALCGFLLIALIGTRAGRITLGVLGVGAVVVVGVTAPQNRSAREGHEAAEHAETCTAIAGMSPKDAALYKALIASSSGPEISCPRDIAGS